MASYHALFCAIDTDNDRKMDLYEVCGRPHTGVRAPARASRVISILAAGNARVAGGGTRNEMLRRLNHKAAPAAVHGELPQHGAPDLAVPTSLTPPAAARATKGMRPT